jgi:hypothetical protein
VKTFLSVGDVVINPDQLAYAAVDGDPEEPRLRLVFAPSATGDGRGELKLEGDDAKAALRWLRLNSSFANAASGSGPSATPLHWGSSNSVSRPNLRDRDGRVLAGAAR